MVRKGSRLAKVARRVTGNLDAFLSAEECQIVDTNRNNFFNAYKQKSDIIEGVPDTIVDKLIDNLTMSGDHDDVDKHIETLQRYRDMGLDEVAFKLHEDHAASIQVIGETIVPVLK